MQIVGGVPEPVAIREGKGGEGNPRQIGKNRPFAAAHPRCHPRRVASTGRQPTLGAGAGATSRRLLRLHPVFRANQPHRRHRPDGRRHRRGAGDPSPAQPGPLRDDPDCWLVASIEDYDLETGLARKGPIFSERVIAPPGGAPHHQRRRRARRHPGGDRGASISTTWPTCWSASRRRRWPNSGRRSSSTRAPTPGKPRTPTCPVRSAASSLWPKPRPLSTRNTSATLSRCATCSRRPAVLGYHSASRGAVDTDGRGGGVLG